MQFNNWANPIPNIDDEYQAFEGYFKGSSDKEKEKIKAIIKSNQTKEPDQND